jgi:hypothetical protein
LRATGVGEKPMKRTALLLLRALGIMFVGFGVVLLLYSTLLAATSASFISAVSPEVATIAFFAIMMPFILPAALCFVVGFTGVYMSRDIGNYENPEGLVDIHARLKRLEYIVDNNFEVVTKKLDKKEQEKRVISEDTILKAMD